jgi:hypothetical protein
MQAGPNQKQLPSGGVTMKKTIIAIFALVLFYLGVPSAHCGNCNEEHETYLNHKINCYLNNSRMLADSKSENLQQYAAVCRQKAIYFSSAKAGILEELNAKQKCLKPHQIDVYLNERYSRLVSKADSSVKN